MNPLAAMQEASNFLSALKSNPISFLLQRNYRIPKEVANDPNQIMQYLLSTGQVTQEQLNAAYQQAMMSKR